MFCLPSLYQRGAIRTCEGHALSQKGTALATGGQKDFLEDGMPELGFNLGKFLVHSAGSQTVCYWQAGEGSKAPRPRCVGITQWASSGQRGLVHVFKF